jgi:hypothetical protein
MRFVVKRRAMQVGALMLALSATIAYGPSLAGARSGAANSGLAFPGQPVGTTSVAQSVLLRNNGPATVSISADALSGPGASEFEETADSCKGATLIAGASCAIAFVFMPHTAGLVSATLTVTSSAAQPLPSFALSGTGVPPGSAPTAGTAIAPSLSSLTLSASSFRAASSGASAVNASQPAGTFIIYSDTQLAITTFVVERRVGGRYHALGSFTHVDAAGTNALRFSGRLDGRALAVGGYRLSASAQSAGGTSATRSVTFKIAR